MSVATLAAHLCPTIGDRLVIPDGVVPAGWWATRELGRGGQAVVLEIRSASGACRALKVDATRDASAGPRLRREAAMLARVHSAHLPRLYGMTEDQGRVALVLELLRGPELGAWLRASALSDRIAAVRHVTLACGGLHELGVAHRDVGPKNVRVVSSHSGPRAVLFDLGIARTLAGAPTSGGPATLPGTPLGTLGYAAPEQLVDGHCATARADVFALGALLFEAVTGRQAMPAQSLHDALRQANGRLWRSHAAEMDHVPPRLRQLVHDSLSPDPSERPASGHAFAVELATSGLPRSVPAAVACHSEALW